VVDLGEEVGDVGSQNPPQPAIAMPLHLLERVEP
jgi:hypothetical protein